MTKTETGYQGWTNHATWCINLHLSSDPGLSDLIEDTAVNGADESEDPAEQVLIVADRIKDQCQEWASRQHDKAASGVPVAAKAMLYDMLLGYLEDVNWREIAEHWLNRD